MKRLARGINQNTHPGEIFSNQIIKFNNLTIERTANLLGVKQYTLSKIVNGKSPINPMMAIRISKVFGGSASFWTKLQSAYYLREAEKEFEIKQIKLNKFKHI